MATKSKSQTIETGDYGTRAEKESLEGRSVRQDHRRIKVMAFMEAVTVSGPAKNLLEFAKAAVTGNEDLPGIDFLITTFHRRGANEDFIKAVGNAGLNICVIPERHVLDFRILPKLRAAITEFSPDIIQTSSIKSHFLIKMLGFHRAYPWIAFHHGYTTTDAKMKIYNRLNWLSLRSAHHVFVVCQAFFREIIRAGVKPERISVQHNMVRPFVRPAQSLLDSLRLTLGIGGITRVILCVGRLSREKGHHDLIRALARMHQESPEIDFRLALVGEGPERESLYRLSMQHGIGDLVIFAGHQRDVSPYYAIADVFVLPSHSEGSPNALLEAMAAGVPSLTTSVGGVPEIASHAKNAFLVQKGDIVAMAGGIKRLLADPSLRERLIENGRKITERYTAESYRRNVVQVYKELLEAHRHITA